ncbi:MAG: hypothetical protein MJK04_28880, partial [Psychrosphaera sp.]|nr:hypothetical protein [Psychrosphaera sp.]
MPTSVEELQQSIANCESQIVDNEVKSAELKAQAIELAKGLDSLAHSSHVELSTHFNQHLNVNQQEFSKLLNEQLPIFLPGWENEHWHDYTHDTVAAVDFFIAGKIVEEPVDGVNSFEFPYFAPFIGSGQSLCLMCDNNDNEEGLAVMQAMVMRIALQLPYAATFTLLDPERLGKSFPMQRRLNSVRPLEHDVAKTLASILEEILRINQDYLDNETDSFEKLNDQIRSNERFEFIFAANFPQDYDRRSIELLQKISKTGPAAGKYLIIHHNQSCKMPADMSIKQFANLHAVPLKMPISVQLGVSLHAQYDLKWDNLPEQSIENQIFSALAKAKPTEHNLRFDEITATAPEQLWQEKADSEIRVPVGGMGSTGMIELWFGRGNDNRECSHGMMGAMPGSGKSNLYHVFILGLACRYSPDEVNLYLIDGKQGVEFKTYENLPHAKVVSLNTRPSLARSVLRELDDEMKRRNEMFQDLGVVNLQGYRELGQPNGVQPRIVLVVDEYQTLFEEDKEGLGSQLMLSLASQGRSAGIHIFVGSQRFGIANMLHQTSIFGNMHLRIGMKMADADITALTEFGRTGKRLLRTCDIAGKAVLNDAAGDDDRNQLGKVAWLEEEQRAELVNQLKAHAVTLHEGQNIRLPVVFNGREQPKLQHNQQLNGLFERYPCRPTDEQWQDFAHQAKHQAGLGETDWYIGEHPSVFWLGQEQNIHGQAKIVFRHRPQENALIVGESSAARYGMMGLMLLQIPMNHEKGLFDIKVIDHSVKGSPWHGILSQVSTVLDSTIGASVTLTSNRKEATGILQTLFDEVESRLEMDEEAVVQQKSIYLLLNEPQRLNELQMETSKHGQKAHSASGKHLSLILQKGPELGIHVIMNIPTGRDLQQLLPKSDVEHFRHRIGLQMTEDESFGLLRSRAAANLQKHGS